MAHVISILIRLANVNFEGEVFHPYKNGDHTFCKGQGFHSYKDGEHEFRESECLHSYKVGGLDACKIGARDLHSYKVGEREFRR